MEEPRHNARLVTGGHVPETTAIIMYVSVVSRETVKIALTLDTLNDLPVKVVEIHNAYITAHFIEKIWTFLYQ